MRVRLVVPAVLAAVAVLVALTSWLFRMPIVEAAIAAPIVVAGAGALAGLVLFWTKVAYESLRRQKHPRRIVAGALAAFALLVVLSFFVELPAAH